MYVCTPETVRDTGVPYTHFSTKYSVVSDNRVTIYATEIVDRPFHVTLSINCSVCKIRRKLWAL